MTPMAFHIPLCPRSRDTTRCPLPKAEGGLSLGWAHLTVTPPLGLFKHCGNETWGTFSIPHS